MELHGRNGAALHIENNEKRAQLLQTGRGRGEGGTEEHMPIFLTMVVSEKEITGQTTFGTMHA